MMEEELSPIDQLRAKYPFLTDEDVMTFFSLVELKPVSQGEVLVRAGDINHHHFRVVKGVLRNYVITSSGEEKTLLFSAEGQNTAAYACIFQDKPATEFIDVLEAGVVGILDMRKFRDIALTNMNLMQVFNGGLTQNLMDTIERMEDYTVLTNEERFTRFRERYPDLLQRIPQKYLASYFGVTPVTLSRIKGRLLRGKSKV